MDTTFEHSHTTDDRVTLPGEDGCVEVNLEQHLTDAEVLWLQNHSDHAYPLVVSLMRRDMASAFPGRIFTWHLVHRVAKRFQQARYPCGASDGEGMRSFMTTMAKLVQQGGCLAGLAHAVRDAIVCLFRCMFPYQ